MLDFSNRVEARFDSDISPYLHLVSFDNEMITEAAVVTPIPYYGTTVELRLIKTGASYNLLINGAHHNCYQ